jgi:hypothetical protein
MTMLTDKELLHYQWSIDYEAYHTEPREMVVAAVHLLGGM